MCRCHFHLTLSSRPRLTLSHSICIFILFRFVMADGERIASWSHAENRRKIFTLWSSLRLNVILFLYMAFSASIHFATSNSSLCIHFFSTFCDFHFALFPSCSFPIASFPPFVVCTTLLQLYFPASSDFPCAPFAKFTLAYFHFCARLSFPFWRLLIIQYILYILGADFEF